MDKLGEFVRLDQVIAQALALVRGQDIELVEQSLGEPRQTGYRVGMQERLLQGVDQVAERVAGIVVRPGGHLHVAAIACAAGMSLITEGAHEVRFAATRLAEQQQGLAECGRRGRGRPVQQTGKRGARLAMDRRHIEGVRCPDLA